MGTHLRVLNESYLMIHTKGTGFRWLSKIFASLCFGRYKIALALERLWNKEFKQNILLVVARSVLTNISL